MSFKFLLHWNLNFLNSENFVRPYWYTMYQLCAVLICSVSCQTLCDLKDCSPLGSSVHGILQARILEWDAMLSSRGSSWPRNQTGVSCIAGEFFTSWDIKETQTNYMFALTFYTSLLLFFIFQVFYYAINMDLWNFLYISLEHFTD